MQRRLGQEQGDEGRAEADDGGEPTGTQERKQRGGVRDGEQGGDLRVAGRAAERQGLQEKVHAARRAAVPEDEDLPGGGQHSQAVIYRNCH